MPVGRISRGLAQAERARQGLIVAPSENPIYTAGQSFSPLNLGADFWRDANTCNTTEGKTVGILPDLVKHFDLKQDTDSLRPKLHIESGRPYLLFDGVDDFMITDRRAAVSEPFTVYFVGKMVTIPGFDPTVYNLDDVSRGLKCALALSGGWQGFSGGTFISVTGSTKINQTQFVLYIADGASSYMRITTSTGVEATSNQQAGASLDRMSVGARPASSAPGNFMFGEDGGFNRRLNTIEIAQLEAYAVKKWSIT